MRRAWGYGPRGGALSEYIVEFVEIGDATVGDRQHELSTSWCLLLSIDHESKRLRKLWPSNKLPFTSVTLARTFSRVVLPTFSERMRNVGKIFSVPSASVYFRFPITSASVIVPVLVNVRKTSAGIVTSDAPLSTTNSRVIALLMTT